MLGNITAIQSADNISHLLTMRITNNMVTPLFIAIGWGDLEVVQTLVELGADVNAIDGRGQSPLDNACHIRPKSDQVIAYLASLPQTNLGGDRWVAFQHAILAPTLPDKIVADIFRRIDPKCMKSLNPGPVKRHRSLIWYAVSQRKYHTVKAMIAAGVSINDPDDVEFPIVQAAIESGMSHLLELILEAGASIPAMPDTSSATDKVPINMLVLLVRYGAPVSRNTISSLRAMNSIRYMHEIVRRVQYSYADPAMAHIRYNTIKWNTRRTEIAFLLDTYHTKEITRHTIRYVPPSAMKMINSAIAVPVLHDMILSGVDPSQVISSPATCRFLSIARLPWHISRHAYIFSYKFRKHIRDITLAQSLTSFEIPFELWLAIMSFCPRSIQISAPDSIEPPHLREFSSSQKMTTWRLAILGEQNNVCTCRTEACIEHQKPNHQSE
jgi:hypothetical protein